MVLGAHYKHGWGGLNEVARSQSKQGVPTITQWSDKTCNLGGPSQIIPRARRCLCHVIGAMYQYPTEKKWTPSVKSHNGHLPCWAGNRTLYLVGKYSPQKILADPLFGVEMRSSQKNTCGPFIKKKKKQTAPLADPCFRVNSGPFIESKKSKKPADPCFGADPLLSGPFIWGGTPYGGGTRNPV